MASIIPSGQSNELLYAIAAILVGSAIITYLLKFVNLDLKPFLSTKQGKALQDISSYLYERFLKALSVSDPLSPPSSPSTIVSRGYLETLPRRTGPRPIITGVSHPRQITHLSPEEKQVPDRLRQLISEVSARYPSTTYLGRSTFESIPSSPTTLYARHRIFNETRYYGEILRADGLDGSIQCTLHPSDVKMVIEKGWGQRHPLSARLASWVVRLSGQSLAAPTPSSQVLLYAPRDQADLDVLGQVVNAAVWWVGGIDARLDDEAF
ncbi:hypothetical protein LTR99_002814 [Exophiala xenobiotica]|uniref:Luciferase domain-containing protein n=1 Tax=Vermiconidia calcicola TaxID=1690605 RepID=A0AAV9QBG5_9PEZI|nr:hypothetical protein LTR92_005555 [Exophiala xenobiotica]KAK5305272.1 hypothetical protein LTR99_002814 [Exophiala xenobiotica]KAK5333489.1 hypothetical protein LTR98_010464 [Exophiala xenobiotica]KAK5538484.1 hypothetical protein LTR25_004026 [Vermiconidia calcicola]